MNFSRSPIGSTDDTEAHPQIIDTAKTAKKPAARFIPFLSFLNIAKESEGKMQLSSENDVFEGSMALAKDKIADCAAFCEVIFPSFHIRICLGTSSTASMMNFIGSQISRRAGRSPPLFAMVICTFPSFRETEQYRKKSSHAGNLIHRRPGETLLAQPDYH
jgi:hypothetical protein